jgi:hypothetical protein
MSLRKAAEMALACLDKAIAYSKNEIKQQDEARLALRQALAQPVNAVNMSQERVDETAKRKHELTDWEAVAADQAMTIAMLKIEQREIWNKAWDAGYEAGLNNQEKETT